MTGQFREHINMNEGSCDGLRCWIVGTGPSLDGVKLSKIKGEYIFALNGAVLRFTNINAYPDAFWVWYDLRTLRELTVRVQKSWKRVQCIIHKKGIEEMRSWKGSGRYIEYVKDRFKAKRTVAETAILLAHFLGFSEIVLVGIDGMQAVDGRPYAEGFDWKQCHFMERGNQRSCRKSSEQMVGALEDVKNRINRMGDAPRIIQTSPIYPAREQFECMTFDEAVESGKDSVKTKPKGTRKKF